MGGIGAGLPAEVHLELSYTTGFTINICDIAIALFDLILGEETDGLQFGTILS